MELADHRGLSLPARPGILWAAMLMVVDEIALSGPSGIRVLPATPTGVGVLTLAGSSGRVDVDRARLFARHGAMAESIRWFGGPGQNAGPWEAPLEQFSARVTALRKYCDHVLVVGTSFGSEAALLTGANLADVDAVVAFAPSDVVWAGITAAGRQTSHWTVADQPLPYLPLLEDWQADRDPPSFRQLYELSRAAAPDALAAATIPVERIQTLVLVAGRDDLVWPSAEHAHTIASRRSQHGLSTTVIVDPGAGHRAVLPGEAVVTGGTRMARGGSAEADRRLGAHAWEHIQQLMVELATG